MAQQLDRIELSAPQNTQRKDKEKEYILNPTKPIYNYNTPSTEELQKFSLGKNPTDKIEELVKKLSGFNIGQPLKFWLGNNKSLTGSD